MALARNRLAHHVCESSHLLVQTITIETCAKLRLHSLAVARVGKVPKE